MKIQYRISPSISGNYYRIDFRRKGWFFWGEWFRFYHNGEHLWDTVVQAEKALKESISQDDTETFYYDDEGNKI